MSLFSPIMLGSIEIDNRFVRSATWEGLATDRGEVTLGLSSLLEKLAQGGIGLIITGHAYISPEGQASPWQLRVASDKCIKGLSLIPAKIHSYRSRVFLQISHAGIFASSLLGGTSLGPSDITINTGFRRAQGREMDKREIRRIVEAFGDAAARAKKAGFDGIQIHAAHGYLLSQFLSPYFNKRRDEYGGDIEGRSRILIEVYESVRERVGTGFPVIIKINCEDFLERGFMLKDVIFVCKRLAELGIDGIEMSGGTLISGELIPSRTREKREVYYKSHALQFRKEVGLHPPLILVGGIRRLETCRELVEDGICDMVALCRPFIREPSLVQRWREGDISPARCVSDNLCFKPALRGKGIYCYREEMERRKDR